MNNRPAWSLLCLSLIGVVSLTGCPPKNKLALAPKADKAAKEARTAEQSEIRIGQNWTEIPQLVDIHFDFDKANLTDTARADLKKNIAVIKGLPSSVTIRVEGNCDSRGTVEYNLALGQRRANAVRSYYEAAGIPKRRIETISFGQERPLCHDETEECWARNRRDTTKVRNTEPIVINPSGLDAAGGHPAMAHAKNGDSNIPTAR